MNCGIYAITNTVTGRVYIGRAVELRERMLQHLSCLRGARHKNMFLQADFDRYGAEAFETKQLLVCSRENLPMYEAICIEGYKAGDREHGYNIMDVVGGSFTHSAESRAKIGKGVSARPNQRAPKSDETKRKIADSLRGRPGVNRGRTFGPEVRAKQAAAKIGNTNALGHKLSDVAKARIAAALKKRIDDDPTIREQLSAQRLGRKDTPETIEKRAAKMRGRKKSPEAIAKFKLAVSGDNHWTRKKKSKFSTSEKE